MNAAEIDLRVVGCFARGRGVFQAIEAIWSGHMLKAVVCDAMKQVRRTARRGPPRTAAIRLSLSSATAHDHPEKSDESWRMCHRIVDCGTDWSQILNLTYQAPLDGSNTAITVMRLAKVSRGKEHLVAKDPRFQHLIRRIQGGTELSDLSPAQLSGIKEGLNKMGVVVDVGSKNGVSWSEGSFTLPHVRNMADDTCSFIDRRFDGIDGTRGTVVGCS